MLEILGGALTFPKIGKEISQVDAGAKVVVVDCQAFFEILNALLEIFHLFVTHADVVE